MWYCFWCWCILFVICWCFWWCWLVFICWCFLLGISILFLNLVLICRVVLGLCWLCVYWMVWFWVGKCWYRCSKLLVCGLMGWECLGWRWLLMVIIWLLWCLVMMVVRYVILDRLFGCIFGWCLIWCWCSL